MNRFLLALLSFSLLSSCATESQLEEETSSPDTHHVRGLGSHNVKVGAFKDSRGVPANFLGQIKSADLTAEKQKIETSQAVAEIVASSFQKGLKLRDMQAGSKEAEWTVTGDILEFSCNQIARAGATVDIRVRLFKAGNTAPAFNKSFTSEKTSAAVSGNDAIKSLAAATLEEVVNRALDDAELRQVIQER
jgi:uncharacterized lipoprotein YajG